MPVVASDGRKVEVFKFTTYDLSTDQVIPSRRWATREFMQRFGVVPTNARVTVPVDKVNALGMSEVDFDPAARAGGFQTSVLLVPRS